ncbi:two-component response regulator [Paenibacillus mucilaginosus 3016]|uniref:Two-component response regulator n=1 Tax=Paenibacillus mucilaginosus 3016 TaxID=1116391 RepID=H6NFD8_9BACL|nr:response regulator transcription factor [Paenibacillus mucilaginosus]AFC29547.1 two-component response regulator [Paenibacillus mucilaginosus 3016]WFA18240.1 response regulator transcription factor [Paenibacillus mucilaginosus]
MKTILIIDDEQEIRELLGIYLKNLGYVTLEASNGAEALRIFSKEGADLIIADIMMPEMDGFELLRAMRSASNIPFLFISAKSDDMDKIYGLQLGADDYVGKPFNPLEVVSRVQALFRRVEAYRRQEGEECNCLDIGDLRLDEMGCRLYKHGVPVDMTSYEFRILALLMKNAGRVMTKAQLYEQVWGEEYIGDENLIMVYISKIREKIEANPRKPDYLTTIRGLGYRFEQSRSAGR